MVTQLVDLKGDHNIVVGQGNVTINPLPPAEARTRADLETLLINVENAWIKGVLEKRVHDAVLLELGKEARADAVDHPWTMILERSEQRCQPLPEGVPIETIFDETRLLLILGEPGSGKTITLLELARALMKRARDNEFSTRPIPVVFNLSTWLNPKQSLRDWMVEELRSKYQTSKELARTWLKDRRLLPLLDGLDEVEQQRRLACVEAINQFSMDYGLQGIVVCCRYREYNILPVRLKFYGAIFLHQLTERQIDGYLRDVGSKLDPLRKLLQQDHELRTLARSPLMLSVMSLAYANVRPTELAPLTLGTADARRAYIFDTYIRRMLARKKTYRNRQTIDRLSWLASNMQAHNQQLFLLEALQPSWLSTAFWRWTYILTSRSLGGLMLMLADVDPRSLAAGASAGFSVGLIDAVGFGRNKTSQTAVQAPVWWQSVARVLFVSLVSGFVIGLIIGIGSGNVGVGLIYGLVNGVIFGLVFGLRGSQRGWPHDIATFETLQWSLRDALKGGLIGGAIGALFLAIVFGLGRFGQSVLMTIVYIELIGIFIGLMLTGLRGRVIEKKSIPNQGIWISLRNALFVGLAIVLMLGLFNALIIGSSGAEGNILLVALQGSIGFGLVFALWFGGLDVIQHYILRAMLYLTGDIPWDYARFLNYAADRILLQSVGGGFIFIHRLLLEHFVALTKRRER